MHRILVLASVLMAGPVAAADYKPVICETAKPYAGKPAPALDLTAALNPPVMSQAPLDAAIAARLDAALADAGAKTGAADVGAAVVTPEGVWRSKGADRLFVWASAGKTLTAVAILQMVEAGQISLDDPVAKWIDGVPNGKAITVRHLLTHTSGLFSANEDLQFHKAPHRLSLTEELKILNRHGAMACPGEQWRYSNSGYALLGAILEAVDGKPYERVIADRIVTPLGLTHLRIVMADDALSDMVPLHTQGKEPVLDPRQPGAAGGVIASPEDMIAVWQALLGGRLLKPETVKGAFADLYPMFGEPPWYGQGVMVYALPGELWVGHSGGAPGVKAVVAYAPAHRAFVAVSLSADGGAEATANLLLRQLPGTATQGP